MTVATTKGVATSGNVGIIKVADRTATSFIPVMTNTQNPTTITTGNFDYIAIGYWK